MNALEEPKGQFIFFLFLLVFFFLILAVFRLFLFLLLLLLLIFFIGFFLPLLAKENGFGGFVANVTRIGGTWNVDASWGTCKLGES